MKGRVPNLALSLIGLIAVVALAGCDRDRPARTDTGSGGNSGKAAPAIYSVGGSISGLTAGGLSLGASGNAATVNAGATSFQLPDLFAAGAAYQVRVLAQPQGQSCSVAAGSGTIGSASITNVTVTCSLNSYSIGGTITGLAASGLVLADGTDTLNVPIGASSFTFPTKIASGGAYAITIQTPPAGTSCQLLNAAGTVTVSAITNVMVVCGQWTWQGGANTTGAAGVYGTRGMASAGNSPGARAAAAAWIDLAGDLWLFGGNGTAGDLNDLWEYVTGTGWTWVGGADTAGASGTYGTLGMADPGNAPGARESAASSIDASGNLWLFGGIGYDSVGTRGSLNDLWEYDAGAKQWIWVSGSATAWASGSTPPTGAPAARSGAVSWIDGSGNLWLFGGTGTDGLLNDLWEFVPGTGSGSGWTFVSGSQADNANGIYGTQGTAAVGNAPGGRSQAVSWIDTSGNLWLFGGSGYGSIGAAGLLNDLWEFDPGTTQWTWVGGSQTVNSAGVYGTQTATANAPKVPGGRYGAAAATDAAGNLWLFGGTGYDSARKQGALNDLWQYNLAAGQWIWMSGSQTTGATGNYGSQGVAAVTNTPGERAAPVAWMDVSGDFWLFGGQGWAAAKSTGMLSDLWEFAQ
ncbi:MAG TPA: kelch repeat-containing protein [Steroidobacteraceae bacterium]|jgi:hypothetical protein|nr:kelch repeat-containing protein [Steroidobacteraceae bacterium]